MTFQECSVIWDGGAHFSGAAYLCVSVLVGWVLWTAPTIGHAPRRTGGV